MDLIAMAILGAFIGYAVHLAIEATDGIPGININPTTKAAVARIVIGGVGGAIIPLAYETIVGVLA